MAHFVSSPGDHLVCFAVKNICFRGISAVCTLELMSDTSLDRLAKLYVNLPHLERKHTI